MDGHWLLSEEEAELQGEGRADEHWQAPPVLLEELPAGLFEDQL